MTALMTRGANACPRTLSSENGVARVIEIPVTTSPQVFTGLFVITFIQRQFAKMKVNLSQPRRMRRLVDVFKAPGEFLPCGLSLAKEAGQFGVNDASNPIDRKNVAAGQLLGLFEHSDCLFDITVPPQQRQPHCILGAQQADDSQVQRLLYGRQMFIELPETRTEEFGSFILQIRIRKLVHQYEHQLWVSWRAGAVYEFQIFQFHVVQLRGARVIAPKNQDQRRDNQQKNTQSCRDPETRTDSHNFLLSFAWLSREEKSRRPSSGAALFLKSFQT